MDSSGTEHLNRDFDGQDTVDALTRTLSMLEIEDAGVTFYSGFRDLSMLLAMRADSTPHFAPAIGAMRAVDSDLCNAVTLLERLEWMRGMAVADSRVEEKWIEFASLDIQAFHTELRSLMDYTVYFMRALSPKPGQVTASFESILARPGKCRLPTEFLQVIERQRRWFSLIRSVRDTLTHRAATSLVFPKAEEGILFQVYEYFTPRIRPSQALMYNGTIAYFDRYAATCLAHIVCFLEDLDRVARARLGLPPAGPRLHGTGSQWRVLRDSIERTQAAFHGSSSSIQQ